MQKLIKLSDTHYIVVDDSEIKVGDWCYSVSNGLIVEPNKKAIDTINSKPMEGIKFLKITHSTQPLEVEPIPDEKFPKVFDKIKRLSLSEVEEVINGYSVEKMADNWFCNEENKNHYENYNEKPAWIKGFNAHKELVKDKLFTVQDMQKCYEDGFASRGTDSPVKDFQLYAFEEGILHSETEWDVTFDEQGKIKLV